MEVYLWEVMFINQLLEQMIERKEYLKALKEELISRMGELPRGKLRISHSKGKISYYKIMKSDDTRGKYISKKEIEQVRQLAQKDYINKLLNKVILELKDIERYLSNHSEENLENLYSTLNEYRKNLVNPIVIPDDDFIQQWENESYETNLYCEEQKVYSTKRNELVRSKSEVIIADIYYELGIPYRYEAGIYLRNGKIRYPDFTLLKTKTREIIYHEHLGMLEEKEYLLTNLLKLDEYRDNGIFLGKNLIITYESEKTPLNIKGLRSMLAELFSVK